MAKDPYSCMEQYCLGVPVGTTLGTINISFEAHLTNPGVYYPSSTAYIHTNNTTQLNFGCVMLDDCSGALSTASPHLDGLIDAINANGKTSYTAHVEIVDASGNIIDSGSRSMLTLAQNSDWIIGGFNNWDGTGTQSCSSNMCT